jgi:hypothetical protein
MTIFRDELQKLLNRHSRENSSNTPDFILADFLDSALELLNVAVRNRESWHKKNQLQEAEKQPAPPSWDELLVPGFEYISRGIPGAFLRVTDRDISVGGGILSCEIVSMHNGSCFPVHGMSVAHEIAAFERGDNTPIPKSGPAHPFKPGCTFKLKNNFGYVFTINSVEGNIVKCTETLGFMDYANHDYKVDQLLQGLKTGELLEFKEPEEGQAQHERGGLKTEVDKGWD